MHPRAAAGRLHSVITPMSQLFSETFDLTQLTPAHLAEITQAGDLMELGRRAAALLGAIFPGQEAHAVWLDEQQAGEAPPLHGAAAGETRRAIRFAPR